MRPVDPVTYAEAAHILGVDPSTVRRHVLAGRLAQHDYGLHRMLSRADVEAKALLTYPHWRHKDDPGVVLDNRATGSRCPRCERGTAQPARRQGLPAVRGAR